MRKTSAPKPTPASPQSDPKSPKSTLDLRAEFLSAAFGLSWQLAVVVLVPVIGGYKLDEHFHKSPMLTIIGFAIAIIGVILLLKQTLKKFSQGLSK